MGRLDGKTVVMTAAGMGIGRASAIAMASEGAIVYATDIDQPSLDSLSEVNSNIRCIHLDVTDSQGIKDLKNKVDVPNVLFNCSGYVHDGTILIADDEAWSRSFEINIRAHARMIETFLPSMIENGGGSIINMASVASSLAGVANRCAYSASKGAVIGLTKSIAKDFVRDGIRCNAVCPGTVLTPSLKARMEAMSDNYEESFAQILSRQPSGEMALPEDIAHIVVYLASDESKVTTGQAIIVDGGMTM